MNRERVEAMLIHFCSAANLVADMIGPNGPILRDLYRDAAELCRIYLDNLDRLDAKPTEEVEF